MATIAQFSQRLSRIANRELLIELLLKAIDETQKIAISLQRQQLEEGYNSEEKEIGRYSKATELIYQQEGRISNQPKVAGELFNFDDTGSFLDGLKLEFTSSEVLFTSSDSKTDELNFKYRNIFGLDPTNLKNYIMNAVLPKFILSIRLQLLLKE